ncbi:MAG: hypothetical protein RIB98_07400 [Acidimicrobiales bacterium]
MTITGASAQVTLGIPAATRHIRVARTVAATIAADLDFSADQIEELRIAVDEVVSLLVDGARADGEVTIRFGIVDDRCIEMHAAIEHGSIADVPALTEQIIRAVVDDVRLDERTGWFSMQRAQ